MIPFLICLSAILLDRYLVEPRRWGVFAVFSSWAEFIESFCYGDDAMPAHQRRRRGMVALALIVLPLVWVAGMLSLLGPLGLFVDVLILYLLLAGRRLVDDARAVVEPLRRFEIEQARRRLARIVGYDTLEMDEQAVAVVALESVLKNANYVIFAILFWYVVMGVSGVVMFCLVNRLTTMWGRRDNHYLNFGWAVARLNEVLSWMPARLTALTYTLLGNKQRAWRCWQQQASLSQSNNDEAVIAAGAGALGIILGGEVYCNGELLKRPQLGEGAPPQPYDVERALKVVQQGQWWWLGAIFILAML